METVTRDELTDRVRELVTERGPLCGRVTLIAVDGPSGSGKTTLAGELARSLGAALLHVDDMHQGWSGLEGTVALARASLVEAWRTGVPASHPTWDWAGDVPGDDVPVGAPELVVLVGRDGHAARHLRDGQRARLHRSLGAVHLPQPDVR